MHSRVISLLFGLLVLSVASRAQPTPGPHKTATIPLPGVEGRIDHMTFDASSGRLYVAALGNDSVEVIDVKNQTVIHSIAGLHNPQGVDVGPRMHHLFVANAK